MRVAAAVTVVGALLCVTTAQAQTGPTRSGYVATVEPICHTGTKQMQAAQRGSRTDFKRGRFARAGAKVIKASKIMHGSLAQVDAVPKPPADAGTLSAWLQKLNDVADDIGRVGHVIKTGRLNKLRRAQLRYAKDGRASNALVAGFGFKSCRIY